MITLAKVVDHDQSGRLQALRRRAAVRTTETYFLCSLTVLGRSPGQPDQVKDHPDLRRHRVLQRLPRRSSVDMCFIINDQPFPTCCLRAVSQRVLVSRSGKHEAASFIDAQLSGEAAAGVGHNFLDSASYSRFCIPDPAGPISRSGADPPAVR